MFSFAPGDVRTLVEGPHGTERLHAHATRWKMRDTAACVSTCVAQPSCSPSRRSSTRCCTHERVSYRTIPRRLPDHRIPVASCGSHTRALNAGPRGLSPIENDPRVKHEDPSLPLQHCTSFSVRDALSRHRATAPCKRLRGSQFGRRCLHVQAHARPRSVVWTADRRDSSALPEHRCSVVTPSRVVRVTLQAAVRSSGHRHLLRCVQSRRVPLGTVSIVRCNTVQTPDSILRVNDPLSRSARTVSRTVVDAREEGLYLQHSKALQPSQIVARVVEEHRFLSGDVRASGQFGCHDSGTSHRLTRSGTSHISA